MADPFDTDAVVPPGVNVPERPGITLIHPYIAPQQASTTQPGTSASGGGGGGGGAPPSKPAEKHPVQPKPTQAPPLNIPGSYRPGRVQPARRASPTGALGQVMHHGGGITAAASGASTTPHPKTQAHPTALLTAHFHTKVALEPTPAHAHLPLGSLSQTLNRFIELGTPTTNQSATSFSQGDRGPRFPRVPGHQRASGFFRAVEKDVIKPLEQAAPIVAPYAAAAAVLAICPECSLVVAGLAAGAASFGANKEFAHQRTSTALIAAAIDAVGESGGEAAQRALLRQVDALLARNESATAYNLLLVTILQANESDRIAAYGHI